MATKEWRKGRDALLGGIPFRCLVVTISLVDSIYYLLFLLLLWLLSILFLAVRQHTPSVVKGTRYESIRCCAVLLLHSEQTIVIDGCFCFCFFCLL